MKGRFRAGYLVPLGSVRDRDDIGGKGKNLLLLRRYGYSIPRTYVVPLSALRGRSRSEVLEGISEELERAIDPDCSYSIRSSASIEDS
jgi:phosphoenolpyruvate synthase/pyruvate phosphate dikinase